MGTTSLTGQRLPTVALLSNEEQERFIAGIEPVNYSICTADQLRDAFRKLTRETQALLARCQASGLLTDDFISGELVDFYLNMSMDWDDSGEYESLSEAIAVCDARLFSSLLVLEHLGSTLDHFGNSLAARSMWAEMAVNRMVDRAVERSGSQCRVPEAYRLTTVAQVRAAAAATVYAAVDNLLHAEALEVAGANQHGSMIDLVPDIYPRCSDEGGIQCTSMVIKHEALELWLRGKSLNEYEAALRLVRARDLGNSTREIDFVIDHLETTGEARAVADGFL